MPDIILEKKVDLEKNRIIIPKNFVKKHGREFKMEIYKDYIKLIPKNIDSKSTKDV